MAYSNSVFKVQLENFYFVFGKEKKFIFVVQCYSLKTAKLKNLPCEKFPKFIEGAQGK